MKPVIACIILLILLSVVSFSEQDLPDPGILPGEPFYGLKLGFEEFRTAITFGNKNLIKRYLYLSSLRLSEFKALTELKEYSKINEIAETYFLMLTISADLSSSSNDAEASEFLARTSANHLDIIDGLEPASAKIVRLKAITVNKKALRILARGNPETSAHIAIKVVKARANRIEGPEDDAIADYDEYSGILESLSTSSRLSGSNYKSISFILEPELDLIEQEVMAKVPKRKSPEPRNSTIEEFGNLFSPQPQNELIIPAINNKCLGGECQKGEPLSQYSKSEIISPLTTPPQYSQPGSPSSPPEANTPPNGQSPTNPTPTPPPSQQTNGSTPPTSSCSDTDGYNIYTQGSRKLEMSPWISYEHCGYITGWMEGYNYHNGYEYFRQIESCSNLDTDATQSEGECWPKSTYKIGSCNGIGCAVEEIVCSAKKPLSWGRATTLCEFGCTNGACNPSGTPSTTCVDSDGGLNKYVKGSFQSEYGTTTESCIIDINPSDTKYDQVNQCEGSNCYIYETYCTATYIKREFLPCEFGCENGACLIEPKQGLSCTGTPVLSINPASSNKTYEYITLTVTGLANCDTNKIHFGSSCSQQVPFLLCTIQGDGCVDTTFLMLEQYGRNFVACVDKNFDGKYLTNEISNEVHLSTSRI